MIKKSISSGIKSLLKLKTTLVILSCFLLICSIFIFDIPVKIVKNSSASPPTILSFNSSSDTAYLGHYIYLYVNATDEEDSEEDLQLIIEYDDGCGWRIAYLDNNTIWDPQGWFKVKFQPALEANWGDYYFRVKAVDTDGNIGFNWVYLSEPIKVIPPPMRIFDMKLGAIEVYRGETLYIFLNASGTIDRECDLIIIVEYNRNNTGWILIPEMETYYEDINGVPNDEVGYWVTIFTTDKSTNLGPYIFRGTVRNSEDDLSYNGYPTYPIPDTAEIKNNFPVALELKTEDSSVERGRTITLTARAEDYEDDPDEIEPFFERRVRNGTWNTTGFSNKQPPQCLGDSWSITFKPRDDAELGSYDFRVYFEDKDGDNSDYLTEQSLIEVANVLPQVTSLVVPPRSGHRLEPLTITADAIDMEQDEMDLEPLFEYRNPPGDWLGGGEWGNYFQNSPEYRNGHWQITFNPPCNAEIGDYSFRVQFIDNDGGKSEWVYLNNSYTLMNINPEVKIRTSPGEWSSSTIIFTASAQDVESSKLFWEWDFGDGETSNEEAPSHSYNGGGIYTVTVTVTDEDGGIATDSITLSIEDVDRRPILSESLRFYFLIVLLVFVIMTTIISIKIFNTLRKRSKNTNQKV